MPDKESRMTYLVRRLGENNIEERGVERVWANFSEKQECKRKKTLKHCLSLCSFIRLVSFLSNYLLGAFYLWKWHFLKEFVFLGGVIRHVTDDDSKTKRSRRGGMPDKDSRMAALVGRLGENNRGVGGRGGKCLG
ncbi:hypothetical protein CEXT_332811 [Caerostris extrusa]|uniref:Uncharacterized protein n=1 Tax=Caerostris extrusa TaxID=172846 RepID=A0AAV4MQQ0_CAEEX|nr:hypothetical protein CEXT_332811 [Caerostris extrusa]